MGASTKKKKEKKKDFQKPKLKVGKVKPKADNHTDTSFKAKSIVLKKQSLSVSAPSVTLQFAHHVSMLRHRSDSQRQESLAHLKTTITSLPPDQPLPEPTAVLLPKLQPLMLDGSLAVRQQLLKLLKCLSSPDIQAQAEQFLLYVRAGMTHLSVDIRLFSIEVLDWLLDVAGENVVSCAGGWIKTLQCFAGLLGWQQQSQSQNGWSQVPTTNGRAGSAGKGTVKQLHALASFISVGIGSKVKTQATSTGPDSATSFPLWDVERHLLPKRPNAFGHLNLFGTERNEENDMLEDREARQMVFAKRFQKTFEDGVDQLKSEGGELGRGAASVRKTIKDGMADFRADDW